MSGSRARRFLSAASIGALLGTLALGTPLGASASGPPPRAAFTASVRADSAESTRGQNDPQVAVDQSGTAYVTW